MKNISFNVPDETYENFTFDTSEGNLNALVNIGLRDFARRDVFPYHFSLYFITQQETLGGYPTLNEIEHIFEFRKHISEIINEDCVVPNAVFLARVLHEGMIELVWRVSKPQEITYILEKFLQDIFEPADFFYNLDSDEGWEFADFYLHE